MTLIRLDDGPITSLEEFDSFSLDDDDRTLRERIRLAAKLVSGGRIRFKVFSLKIDDSCAVVEFRGVRLDIE